MASWRDWTEGWIAWLKKQVENVQSWVQWLVGDSKKQQAQLDDHERRIKKLEKSPPGHGSLDFQIGPVEDQ